MGKLNVRVVKLRNYYALPYRATFSSAGADLFAAIDSQKRIDPMGRMLIPTGIAIELPIGYEGQIRPRSGLAKDYGITVLNAPGTIDSDYRGEIGVILVNLSDKAFDVTTGMRIAQLVIAKHEIPHFEPVDQFECDTERGVSGFGSTGLDSFLD